MEAHELRIEIEGATPDVEVSPSTLPFLALAELVRGFVEAIVAASGAVGLPCPAEALSLPRIEPGSARPVLAFPRELEDTVESVLQAVESRDYSRVGVGSNAALHRAFKVALTRRWNLKLRRRGWREDAPPVEVSELAPIPEPPEALKGLSLTGETVLYGRVVGVHGDKTPRVTIKPADGSRQVAAVCESLDLAVCLGSLLYQTVGLAGVAGWNASTLEIETFKVKSITTYRDTPIVDALARIREAAGGAYDDPKVIEELRVLRGEH